MLSTKLHNGLLKNRLIIVMVTIIIIMAFCEPSFFSTANLVNIFSHVSINGILAVGMTPLMISMAFDISIGSIMVLSGVIAIITTNHSNPTTGIFVGIASGIIMGLVNGILVAKIKINSFIATLGTMVIFQGIAFAITNMQPVTANSPSYQLFAAVEIMGVPIVIIYFALVTLIIWFILRFTKLGQYAYAIGGNEKICRMMGIKVDSFRIMFFVISGVCASFAGVLLSSKINAASGVFGENIALVIVAGIVLGGVHLTGGVGTVPGVVQGIILLQLLENVTVYLGLFGYYQLLFRSLILISVVIFDVYSTKHASKILQDKELFRIIACDKQKLT